jgi:hypothetical protein
MRGTPQIKRHDFTLLEVLIAVIILVGMMTMMLYIVSTAQKSFKLQEARTAMFQKSRMIFDLIERDVRSLVTHDADGKEVGYCIFDYDPSDLSKRTLLTLVSSGDPDDEAHSRLTEISYSFHTDSSDPDNRFLIKRQLVTEAHGEDWNFCGAPAKWEENNSTASPKFETVIGGVNKLSISFIQVGGTTAESDKLPKPPTTFTEHPIRVIVNVELFDEAMSGPEFDKNRNAFVRGFTKVFYIGHLHAR